ncbi:hypothetical protein GCM10010340_19290 [Streptomyces griseoloalbus]|nr:hypothetical protein GCM10010340_19290 [Streptomyces albaduncus]
MGTHTQRNARYDAPAVAAAAAHPHTTTATVRRTDCHGSTAYPPMLFSGLMLLPRMPSGTAAPCAPPSRRLRESGTGHYIGTYRRRTAA